MMKVVEENNNVEEKKRKPCFGYRKYLVNRSFVDYHVCTRCDDEFECEVASEEIEKELRKNNSCLRCKMLEEKIEMLESKIEHMKFLDMESARFALQMERKQSDENEKTYVSGRESNDTNN